MHRMIQLPSPNVYKLERLFQLSPLLSFLIHPQSTCSYFHCIQLRSHNSNSAKSLTTQTHLAAVPLSFQDSQDDSLDVLLRVCAQR